MARKDSDGLGRCGELCRNRPRRAADCYAIAWLRRAAAGGEEGNVNDVAVQSICRYRKSAPPCKAPPRALARPRAGDPCEISSILAKHAVAPRIIGRTGFAIAPDAQAMAILFDFVKHSLPEPWGLTTSNEF
jgi:hypothetical protein